MLSLLTVLGRASPKLRASVANCALALRGIRVKIRLALCLFLGAFSASLSALAGQPGETMSPGSIDPATFHFNDLYTTPFGPAYADIWTAQSNFLACRPPVDQAFSYALCYFSGAAVATPIQTSAGVPSANPPLLAPCRRTVSRQLAHAMRYRQNNTRLLSPIL
jgi:hypothetical protein